MICFYHLQIPQKTATPALSTSDLWLKWNEGEGYKWEKRHMSETHELLDSLGWRSLRPFLSPVHTWICSTIFQVCGIQLRLGEWQSSWTHYLHFPYTMKKSEFNSLILVLSHGTIYNFYFIAPQRSECIYHIFHNFLFIHSTEHSALSRLKSSKAELDHYLSHFILHEYGLSYIKITWQTTVVSPPCAVPWWDHLNRNPCFELWMMSRNP